MTTTILTKSQAIVLAYFADHTDPRKHEAVRVMSGYGYHRSRKSLVTHRLAVESDEAPYLKVTESGHAALAAYKVA